MHLTWLAYHLTLGGSLARFITLFIQKITAGSQFFSIFKKLNIGHIRSNTMRTPCIMHLQKMVKCYNTSLTFGLIEILAHKIPENVLTRKHYFSVACTSKFFSHRGKTERKPLHPNANSSDIISIFIHPEFICTTVIW